MLALNTNQSDEDNRYVSSNKWIIYHVVMMMINLGLPALFCWHSDDSYIDLHSWLHVNKYVWWGSVILLYIWSLIGMKIYPEDDFS